MNSFTQLSAIDFPDGSIIAYTRESGVIKLTIEKWDCTQVLIEFYNPLYLFDTSATEGELGMVKVLDTSTQIEEMLAANFAGQALEQERLYYKQVDFYLASSDSPNLIIICDAVNVTEVPRDES